MNALRYKLWTALGIALMCVPGSAWAQQQSQDQGQSQDQTQPQGQGQAPIPAYRSPLASAGYDVNPSPQELTPDTQPLAGAQTLSLGIPESQNYWQPSANVTTSATSNGLGASTGWVSYTNLGGGLALHDKSGRSDLALNYLGGGVVSNEINDATFQELSLVESLSWERTTLSFLEQASYLPQTGFGYGGIGALSLPGGNPVVPQPGLGVTGTILTTRGNQLDESSLAEIDTRLSPRSSLTFLGGYSLLHFFGTSLLNTSSATFQAGFNHDLTRENTIAVLYRFNALRFSGNSQSINDNVAQLSFARRVTGRLAFQAGAGPEVSFFNMPVVTGSSGPASSTLVNWSASTSLTYAIGQESQLSVSYGHGVTGGSGVFTGSVGDTVTGSITHQLARTVLTAFSTGYARNHALAIPTTPTVNQTFDYWFGNATLTHSWARTMNMSLSYEEIYQGSNVAFCAGITCGKSVDIHQISMGLGWQAGPLVF